MLYYVYIISYTFFFHARPRASRVSIVTSCVKLSFGGIFPLLLLIFFFSLSMRTCTCASIFFSLFFFSDKCHLWFVYKVYVCIIHSYVLRVYALHSCFIHIHIYIYACISVYVYVYACVYVCVLIRVCARAWYIYLSRIISVASLQITRTLYKGFFFSFARLLLLEFASSDCIHLLSLKYMQRGCHGTPRAVHRIRGNTSRKFSFF